MKLTTDFIVVGSGIAGLNASITLADFGKVTIITKKNIADSSTNIAQGGVAAVTQKEDSVSSHEKDTMTAGAFHNNKDAVQFLVKNGKNAIARLISVGVPFEKKSTLEAAHSFPRILHATDITGHEIEKALVAKILQNKHITVLENAYAIDLIVSNNTCFGITIINDKKIKPIFARAVVLATGGAGQLYKWTTNPSVVTGDGIAMAHRAGAKTKDLEFMQFHPTALQENSSPLFLLSEALRGEGAKLVDKSGKRFVDELAPRDVVARAIFTQQKKGNVYLDIRYKGKEFLQKRFPTIYQTLKTKGYDLATNIIPVTPAAHFLCGGIITNLYGKTSIKNLFAFGEVACTGVHGANRLASNSLLEGIVFSNQITKCIDDLPKIPKVIPINTPIYKNGQATSYKTQIQNIMWKYVGIKRSHKGLSSALVKLKKLEKKIDSLEEKNMAQVSILITKAALKRKKSLGTHYLI